MQTQKVADMTVEELKALINELVDKRINQLQTAKPIDKDKLKQVMESIERHRWTPPPGTPTASQMIIEERNQWRQGM